MSERRYKYKRLVFKGSTLKKGTVSKRKIRDGRKAPLMPAPPKKDILDYRRPHAYDNAKGAYKKSGNTPKPERKKSDFEVAYDKHKNNPPSEGHFKRHRNSYLTAGAATGIVASAGYVAKKKNDNKSVKNRVKRALGH